MTNTGEQQPMRMSPEFEQWRARKGQEFQDKVQAVGEATNDPLPGPLYDAFCKGAIEVFPGTRVRKVVARDWQIMRALNSPLLKAIEECDRKQLEQGEDKPASGEAEFDPQDEWALCWLFTHAVQEAREAFERGGAAEIKKLSQVVGDTMGNGEVRLVIIAVMEQIKRSRKTALKYSIDLQEKGDISFFRDAEANPKTASAGGSTT